MSIFLKVRPLCRICADARHYKGDLSEHASSQGLNESFEVGDCLAQWWRPNFEQFMVGLPSIFQGGPAAAH